jgi:L-ascorbate metabolism protein UlaG (beta-lactamase superfamily)
MADDLFFVRPNLLAEPLVDRWYAWAHLIPPVTAARNLTHRHLPIMESFIASPTVHERAVKNPDLLGGPFMDHRADRVGEVAKLRAVTLDRRANLVALSAAIDNLHTTLADASGYSLEPLYEQVPEPLQGFVELLYDLSNRASFRLIEPLLYRSAYANDSGQSVVFSLLREDNRPFILSTPRLIGEDEVEVTIPFRSEGLDLFFGATRTPQSFAALRDALEWDDASNDAMRRLLTTEPPRPYRDDRSGPLRWRYFGHACILLEAGPVNFLIDPVLSYTYETSVSRYTYDDLPDVIDYVLITHNHQDHVMIETLLRMRHRIHHIVVPRSVPGALQDPSLRLMLEHVGFKNVIELDEMDEIRTGQSTIVGLPFLGEHGDLHVHSKMAWYVKAGNHRLLFAADSSTVSPAVYRHVRSAIGDVDVLFLGMECDGAPVSWIYGPLFPRPLLRPMDHSRRLAGCDYKRAVEMATIFNCREAYVYAMGQEPWLKHIMAKKYTEQSDPILASDRFIEHCRRRGIKSERLFGERELLLE